MSFSGAGCCSCPGLPGYLQFRPNCCNAWIFKLSGNRYPLCSIIWCHGFICANPSSDYLLFRRRNSTGGWRGAVLAGITAGLMLSIGQALTVGCLSTTIADFARWSNGLGVCKIIQQRKLLEIQVESLYWEKHISINKRIWYNWRCAGRRLSWNASLMEIRKLGKDMLCIRF